MKTEKSRGIVTIAVRHPYYGRMAYNLCATVKAENPDAVFAVIADESGLLHLSEYQKQLFDEIIPIDGKPLHGVSLKLMLHELSPFDETIFIDADTIWIPGARVDNLFNEFPEDCYFSAITEGEHNFETKESDVSKKYTFWADVESIGKEYRFKKGKIFQWRSEVMFLRKGKKTKEFFALANKIYSNPSVGFLKFVNGVPDELAINIAACKIGLCPHEFRWRPSFWVNMHGARIPQPRDLALQKYYVVSCGGGYAAYSLRKNYARIMKVTMKKLNRQHVFELIPKTEFIKERQAKTR